MSRCEAYDDRGNKRLFPECGPWADRVRFGTTAGGATFAFRPDEVTSDATRR